MAARQCQRKPPPLPKLADDGDPKFVIFIRMANKMAMKQFRVLRSATEFKYGYELILPSHAEFKTVFDKVQDFFGDAKESFRKMTFLNSGTESSEGDTKN